MGYLPLVCIYLIYVYIAGAVSDTTGATEPQYIDPSKLNQNGKTPFQRVGPKAV